MPKKVISGPTLKQILVGVIPVGNASRIKSGEISRKLGIEGSTIRALVNELRKDGVPIASDSDGYYIAEKPDELDHTIAQLNSRIHKMIQAREGLKIAKSKLVV